MRITARALVFLALTSASGSSIGADAVAGTGAATSPVSAWSELRWPRGIENQRKADRGDGTFLNPIVPGDHPDPTILKDGDDYYMTFSSFDSYPGLVIWHSRDLVNWEPVTAALTTPIGSVWAPELTRHDGRYYIYMPARTENYRSIYIIHAGDIRGPWSEPVDLELHRHIDPGHAVGKDGKRYLFLSQSPDGKRWRKFPVQMETSGYHHNVAYEFLSLRPAIYAAGKGEVRFRNLEFRAF